MNTTFLKKLDIKKQLTSIFHGTLIGFAEIVPGVSGTAIALILGIYDDIINILYSIIDILKTFVQVLLKKTTFKEFIEKIKLFNFTQTTFLGIGVLISVAVLSNFVIYVLTNYPHYLFAALLGLLFSVLALPIKVIKIPTLFEFLTIIISFVGLFFILSLSFPEGSTVTGEPSLIYLFIGGIVGMACMILPGVSGSFMLIVMGIYYYILSAISHVFSMQATISELFGLSAFALGLFTGFITIVNFLKKALENHLRLFLAFITGLLLASAKSLWPFVKSVQEGEELVQKVVDISTFSNVEVITIVMIFIVTLSVFGFINLRYAEI